MRFFLSRNRGGELTCRRFASYDTHALRSSDKFSQEQLANYVAPVLFVLDCIKGMSHDQFRDNIQWITPSISSLILSGDRRIREKVASIYADLMNPYILSKST